MAAVVVYDPANEALVIRAAIALAVDESDAARVAFRALVHTVGEDEFLVGQHCSLWRVFRKLSDGGLDYSPETVRQFAVLESHPVDDDHLTELENTALVPPNLEFHVETLRWDATRARVLQGSLNDLVGDLKDPKVTVERATSSARAVLRALEGGSGRRFIARPEESVASYRAELEARRKRGKVWGCGFPAVDLKMSEGFMPGNTTVITGLSGSGKSTFAAKLAIELSKLGRKPLVCAWEMGRTSTLDIMISSVTGILLDTIVQGTYTEDELLRIDKANRWVNTKMRFMENAFFAKVEQNKRRQWPSNERNLDILEGYIAEAGCDVVIMDLWDRVLSDHSPDGVTTALYRQQTMHREYGVHGILLVQLRLKDVEKRADKRPTRESIKGVGTYVEVPDLIFGVHRDAQFKAVPDDSLELICLKQRKGKLNWAVRFDWVGEQCRIANGEEVPYNPGLELVSEHGPIDEPSAIRTKPRKGKINRRD